jgi:hypothetical protein
MIDVAPEFSMVDRAALFRPSRPDMQGSMERRSAATPPAGWLAPVIDFRTLGNAGGL